MSRLSFRRRLVLLSAGAVALAIAVAAVATYVLVRAQLRAGVDDGLRTFAADVVAVPREGPVARERTVRRAPVPLMGPPAKGDVMVVLPSTRLGGQAGYAQLVDRGGEVLRPPGRTVELPVPDGARAVAAGRREAFTYDADVRGEAVRVLVAPAGRGRAIQAAQSLEGVDGALRRLALVLLAVTIAGVAVAVLLGRVVARTAARPVRALTAGAEHVTATQDLGRRVEAPGDDELARLAGAFNTMLAALAESRRAQRRLVADASHELRTPLTTVMANVELLGRADALPPGELERMRGESLAQLQELNALVGDLVELAREEQPPDELEELDLGELVAGCLERLRPRAGDVRFTARLDHSPVRVARARVERAVTNLLDNARKYSPPGGRVEVEVREGAVVVRDEGPGIDPADRPHVFDRFFRAPASRALPGSGLGLAIVRQVAESHGGRAWAAEAPGGGAELHLELPAHRALSWSGGSMGPCTSHAPSSSPPSPPPLSSAAAAATTVPPPAAPAPRGTSSAT